MLELKEQILMSLIPAALLTGNALAIFWFSKRERAYVVTRRTALVGLLVASLIGVTCSTGMLLTPIDDGREPPRTAVRIIGSMLFSAFLMGLMWHGILCWLRAIKSAAEFLRWWEHRQDKPSENASVARSAAAERAPEAERDP